MYGGTGGRPFIWKRPNKGGDTASDANMCLLAFQGRAAGEVDRLAPIWCIDPPVKFELDFKSFDKSVDPKAVKMEEVKTYNQDHKNGLSTPRPEEVTWTYSVEKSTTITLSEESRHAIGGKYGIETSVEGSAGVPVLGQVTAKTTVGWQVNTDHSWGGSKTDGKTEHKTDTTSFKETITIAPKTRAIGVGMSSLAKVTGLKWTGTVCEPRSNSAPKLAGAALPTSRPCKLWQKGSSVPSRTCCRLLFQSSFPCLGLPPRH